MSDQLDRLVDVEPLGNLDQPIDRLVGGQDRSSLRIDHVEDADRPRHRQPVEQHTRPLEWKLLHEREDLTNLPRAEFGEHCVAITFFDPAREPFVRWLPIDLTFEQVGVGHGAGS